MKTQLAPPDRCSLTLDEFFEYMDSLAQRAPLHELEWRLRALAITIDDVAAQVQFGTDRYRRNLMREGAQYQALILCWRSGQRSPIHNHAHSTCGVRVLKGIATETVFDVSPCGLVKAVSSSDCIEGDVVVTQDSDTHQMSNLEEPGHDLVTLHIYSPPLRWMDTFSLTNGRVERVSEHVDHIDGSGI
ncbi:MAG: cysteine dioxygenase family protein [Phycisphaerales bacterium]|nr:cysteine dioxygenase family protein [Phycisphaerales bacterium]